MEQILSSCCGFLHDMNPVSEEAMIKRYLDTSAKLEDREGNSGIKRRAFMITSKELEGSVQLIPGYWALTLTPWNPEKSEYPADAHHVKSYTKFYYEYVMNSRVLSIAGFDGEMDSRQKDFDEINLKANPKLPRMCILSNGQHEYGEPFLLKNGFKLVLRGRNKYWYDNHLSIFIRMPEEKAA